MKDIKALCPLCANSTIRPLYRKDKYTIGQCKQCHLLFTHPLPTEKELKELYADKYFEPYIVSADKKRLIFEKRINWLQRYCSEGKLLDVGCETGIFLELMQQRGWEVWGVELSEVARHYAKEKLGPLIFQGSLEDAHYDNDNFDVVTLWHTLEHLVKPLETLQEVKRILRPGGLLFIEVPNTKFLENYFFRIFGITQYLFFVEHLIHFSPKTLIAMTKKAGFVVREITTPDVSITERDYKSLIGSLFIYLSKLVYSATKLNLTHGIRLVGVKEKLFL